MTESRDLPLPGSAADMARSLRAGSTTAERLTQAALNRIAALDPEVRAFTRVDAAGALEAARVADADLARGVDRGPLHGIPFAVKDIYDAAGLPTTCQSRLRAGHVAAHDSAAVERMRGAGAILLGKLDTFEFALGGPSDDLPLPPARNPWNFDHETGGSSSGSAAAIAAGFVPVALGTCTTGSIRGPAAWCGAVGLKPTFGRVSRRGVYPLSSSLDHCGPLARSVRDAANALQVLAGYDPADPACANRPVGDYVGGLEDGVAGLTVGVARTFFRDDPALSDDTRDAISRAEDLLRAAGATIRDVSLPDHGLFVACARTLMAAEAFAVHRANLRHRLSDYGELAARRFAIGATVSAADYIDTQRVARRLREAVNSSFRSVDIILSVISLATAPRISKSKRPATWPLQASAWNLTGHPAVAVPMGLGADGLPLSVQLIGRAYAEATILRAARVLEREGGWARVPLPGEVRVV